MSLLSNLYTVPDIFSVSCSTHGVRVYFQSGDEISLKKMYLRPGREDILRVVKGQGVHTGESYFLHALLSSMEVINPRQSWLWPLHQECAQSHF